MITKLLSQKLVLLVIGLAAGSGILIPASYGSFHPVTSSEIADNTIQSVDIKDGEVKAADIGTDQVKAAEIAANAVGASEIVADSVTASELAGVTKLLFSSCTKTENDPVGPDVLLAFNCGFRGADNDDFVIAQKSADSCFAIVNADPITDIVVINLRNVCSFSDIFGTATFSIIVYDT